MTDDVPDADDSSDPAPTPTPPDTLDVAPRIELRVPGPWRSANELADALAKAETGFALLDEETMVYVNKKGKERRFHWGVSEPDDEIADIFADTGRPSAKEIEAIRGHACKIHVEGPGGSVPAAKAMMRAGTALLKAGGLGVMIDSSTAAHGPRDWMKLANDKEPGGLYWAYVAAARGPQNAVYSVGMHCLGFRDAELIGEPDLDWAGFMLHNFLGYTYQSGVPVLDGDPLGDERSVLYRARHYPCHRFEPGSPLYNPYGVWRLERVGPDEAK
jgi:hypothetical protein